MLLTTTLAIATSIGAALIPSGWTWARNGIVVWTAVGMLTMAGVTLAVVQQYIAGHTEGDADGESGTQMLVGPFVSGMTGGVVIGTNVGQLFTGPVTLTSATLAGLGGPLSGPLSNLPLRDPDFTGREEVLAIVGAELAEAGVVAVHGLGGVGKSQLAIEFARRGRVAGRFDVIWWVRSESAATIVEDFAALASALKVPVGQDQERTVAAVREALRRRDRWLLIFDNVPEASVLRTWLPEGGGQVLITSRDRSWVGLARRVELGSFSRSESLGYLRRRIGRDEPAAEALAEVLGDLPLALAQAASYIELHGGLSAGQYLQLYREREGAGFLLSEGLAGYPHTVATTWLTHYDQLAESNPAALQLLRLCSYLDPDEIDLGVLLRKPEVLDIPLTALLAEVAGVPVAREQTIGALTASGLVTRLDDRRISLHRLVSQVTRHQLSTAGIGLGRRWAQHSVDVVAEAADFPAREYEVWEPPKGILSHLLQCANLISAYDLYGGQGLILLQRLGEYLTHRARFTEAESVLALALSGCTRHVPEDSATAQCLNLLATLYRDRGDYSEAESLYLRALIIREAEGEESSLALAQTLSGLGWLYRKHGRYIAAEPLFKRALFIQESLLGRDSLTVARTSNDLGCLTEEMGRYPEAERLYLRALRIREESLGLENLDTATTLWDLGWVYRRKGDYVKAGEFFVQALGIRSRFLGEDSLETAMSSCDLAWIYTRNGRLADARVLLEKSLETRLKIVGEDHPDTAMSLHELAFLAEVEGGYDTARDLYDRALAIRQKRLGPDHPDTGATIAGLAHLCAACGDRTQALSLYDIAIALHGRLPDIVHPDFPVILFNTAEIHEADGDRAGAIALLERAISAANSLELESEHRDLAPIIDLYRNLTNGTH